MDTHKIKCKNCGYLKSVWDGGYIIDGVCHCKNCIPTYMYTKPLFIQHIPGFADGCDAKMFNFVDLEDLLSKLKSDEDSFNVFVYSDGHIMAQNIFRSYWWVLGSVKNFDLSKSGLRKVNYKIYNKDKSINKFELIKFIGKGIPDSHWECGKNKF